MIIHLNCPSNIWLNRVAKTPKATLLSSFKPIPSFSFNWSSNHTFPFSPAKSHTQRPPKKSPWHRKQHLLMPTTHSIRPIFYWLDSFHVTCRIQSGLSMSYRCAQGRGLINGYEFDIFITLFPLTIAIMSCSYIAFSKFYI